MNFEWYRWYKGYTWQKTFCARAFCNVTQHPSPHGETLKLFVPPVPIVHNAKNGPHFIAASLKNLICKSVYHDALGGVLPQIDMHRPSSSNVAHVILVVRCLPPTQKHAKHILFAVNPKVPHGPGAMRHYWRKWRKILSGTSGTRCTGHGNFCARFFKKIPLSTQTPS